MPTEITDGTKVYLPGNTVPLVVVAVFNGLAVVAQQPNEEAGLPVDMPLPVFAVKVESLLTTKPKPIKVDEPTEVQLDPANATVA